MCRTPTSSGLVRGNKNNLHKDKSRTLKKRRGGGLLRWMITKKLKEKKTSQEQSVTSLNPKVRWSASLLALFVVVAGWTKIWQIVDKNSGWGIQTATFSYCGIKKGLIFSVRKDPKQKHEKINKPRKQMQVHSSLLPSYLKSTCWTGESDGMAMILTARVCVCDVSVIWCKLCKCAKTTWENNVERKIREMSSFTSLWKLKTLFSSSWEQQHSVSSPSPPQTFHLPPVFFLVHPPSLSFLLSLLFSL